MTKKSYFFTRAPVDYDYGRTETVHLDVQDHYGALYRLVCVTERDPDTDFLARYQCGRYWSGMHRPWEADSDDAKSLGFPSLASLLPS